VFCMREIDSLFLCCWVCSISKANVCRAVRFYLLVPHTFLSSLVMILMLKGSVLDVISCSVDKRLFEC
jgi:hypothetical protein